MSGANTPRRAAPDPFNLLPSHSQRTECTFIIKLIAFLALQPILTRIQTIQDGDRHSLFESARRGFTFDFLLGLFLCIHLRITLYVLYVRHPIKQLKLYHHVVYLHKPHDKAGLLKSFAL